MPDIYDQHLAAFQNVSAYVVMKNGERVATIAFKFPRDGAGRLYAYCHWFGTRMVRGFASGCGYDKRSAACADAMRHFPDAETREPVPPEGVTGQAHFWNALRKDGGSSWDRELERAGFDVWQAV